MEDQTKQIRIQIAVQICIDNPELYQRVLNERYSECQTENEKTRYVVLQNLIRLEPSIRFVLDYYEGQFSEIPIIRLYDITPTFSTEES